MLIEARNLTKRYGKKTVLKNVNLNIDQGQLVAYLGTNGAGKSTTINILMGLLAPTAGRITYAQNLKMGVVFQTSVLDDSLTVSDNLNLRLRLYKHASKEWLAQLIEVIGVKKFLSQKYGTLSGGQKRRVDIVRALIDKPDLLFLDEPTTGLDLQTRLAIWNLLQQLQTAYGLTIFLTTHYLEEAANADQMYILENGQLLAKGSASEIKQQYAPSKLTIAMEHPEKLLNNYQAKVINTGKVEVSSLSTQAVLKLLQEFKADIIEFEYRQGSIDDAFIAVTGKELQ